MLKEAGCFPQLSAPLLCLGQQAFPKGPAVRVIPIIKHFQKFIVLFSSHDTQQVPTWYHENSFLIKKEKRKMLTRAAVSLFKNARALPEEKFWWIRCPAYIH